MKAIWKFAIPQIVEEICISMPDGAQVLCVQNQCELPCIWALVDIDAPKVIRVFNTYGTGHQHEDITGKYIGTYQLAGGTLVFHVFELAP